MATFKLHEYVAVSLKKTIANCFKTRSFNHSSAEASQLIKMRNLVEDWADLVHDAAMNYKDFVNVNDNV